MTLSQLRERWKSKLRGAVGQDGNGDAKGRDSDSVTADSK